MSRRLLGYCLSALLLLGIAALGWWLLTSQPGEVPLDKTGQLASQVRFSKTGAKFNVQLAGARDKAKIVQLDDGSLAYLITRIGPETDRILTPDEFTKLVYDQRRSASFLESFLNVSGPVGFAWVLLGLGGQAIFMCRMLVQWFHSEKQKRSVIPVSFWWLSLIGSTMSLVYFIWRRDIVGILGQATGWIIYIRNLVLIQKSRN